MDWPRPLDVGSAIAKAVRPFYTLWMYVPAIPDILGMERARKKAIEAIVMLLIQSAVRGLL